MDRQHFWGFLAHTSIIVGMMLVIFFVIDRFNPAMEFLSSNISKWLILLFALCSVLNGLFSAVFLFQKQKRHEEKLGNAQPRANPSQNYPAQQRLTQPQYDPRDNIQRQRTLQGHGYENGHPAQQPRQTEQRQYQRPVPVPVQSNKAIEYLNPRVRR